MTMEEAGLFGILVSLYCAKWRHISEDSNLYSQVCDLSKTSIPSVESTQPLIQWVPGFFLELNRPRCEAAHSPPSSAELKNE